MFQTFSWTGWYIGSWWNDLWYNWSGILGLIIFLVAIGIVVGSGGPPKQIPEYRGAWAYPSGAPGKPGG